MILSCSNGLKEKSLPEHTESIRIYSKIEHIPFSCQSAVLIIRYIIHVALTHSRSTESQRNVKEPNRIRSSRVQGGVQESIRIDNDLE